MIVNTKYDVGEQVKFKMLGHWSDGTVCGIYPNGKRTEYDVAFLKEYGSTFSNMIRLKSTEIKR